MLQGPRLREERRQELWAPCGRWGRGDRGGPGEEEGRRLQLLNWLESLWRGGEACKAEAVTQQGRPHLLFLGSAASVDLIGVVDEVAAGAVRAEAYRVEGAAWLRLVLRVPAETSELIIAMGKLALGAVLAGATLLIGATQFGLVAGGDVSGWGRGSCSRGGSS